MAYFERLSTTAFRATEHVSGAWDEATQHIAPALGLMVHVVETDRDARRDDGLVVGRLSYDILGTIPVDEMESTGHRDAAGPDHRARRGPVESRRT